MLDVEALLGLAVKHFWATRAKQQAKQGETRGGRDAGSRGAVTGGKHADGFVRVIGEIVRDAGLDVASVRFSDKRSRALPGYFRPSKEWDLVVVHRTDLVAAIEMKSQVGSFGNNFNNRVEEALGNATDFWAAFDHSLLQPSVRPWLGYLFMLEENTESSRSKAKIELQPFRVDEAFQTLSYQDRYQEVCRRLVRHRLYDAACVITSNRETGLSGKYAEPDPQLGIRVSPVLSAPAPQSSRGLNERTPRAVDVGERRSHAINTRRP